MISLSAWCLRKKPTPIRDHSKRNFQGEQLEEYMCQRAKGIEELQPFQNAVADVIGRFKVEVEEKERLKHDLQGEVMKRELAERQKALENLCIIAESNKELERKRNMQKLFDEEEVKKAEEEEKRLIMVEKEKNREENRAMVLRVIEESKEFITPENIDEKIDAVLENVVNYNFALTSEGNKIYATKPPGNLDGFKGASPTAFIAGGINSFSNEFQTAFQGQDLGGYNLRRGDSYRQRLRNVEKGTTEKDEGDSATVSSS